MIYIDPDDIELIRPSSDSHLSREAKVVVTDGVDPMLVLTNKLLDHEVYEIIHQLNKFFKKGYELGRLNKIMEIKRALEE